MKFKIGDRIGQIPAKKHNSENTSILGTVTDVTMAGKYLIKWDDTWYNTTNSGTKLWEESALMPSAEVIEITSKLEEEFNALEAEVKLKVKEASKIIKEASDLAKTKGYELVDLYNATGPLYNAMDDAGWQTSSFNC